MTMTTEARMPVYIIHSTGLKQVVGDFDSQDQTEPTFKKN